MEDAIWFNQNLLYKGAVPVPKGKRISSRNAKNLNE